MNNSFLIKRFLSKVKKTKYCWVWIASKNKDGYGWFRYNNRMLGSHRISWLIFIGKIPKNLRVLHKCDNPSCVNPEHLFLGTQKDNVQDCIKKKRFKNNQGETNPNCKISNEDIVFIYNNKNLGRTYFAKKFNVHPCYISSIFSKRNNRVNILLNKTMNGYNKG